MSTHCPSTLNFQPWYTHRNPCSSLRPKNSEAPRCGQLLWISPTSPVELRNPMRSSPSSRTRSGAPSRSGSSSDWIAGSQYCRNRSPIGVPGPIRHRNSVSALLSMLRCTPARDGSSLAMDNDLERLTHLRERKGVGDVLRGMNAACLEHVEHALAVHRRVAGRRNLAAEHGEHIVKDVLDGEAVARIVRTTGQRHTSQRRGEPDRLLDRLGLTAALDDYGGPLFLCCF